MSKKCTKTQKNEIKQYFNRKKICIYLLSQGVQEDHIIGLALDDWENKKLLNPDRLLDYINNHIVKDGKKNYVILDEVQLVDDFVSVLLSMTHKQNVETYVSGSNSKFLSRDVVTEFRGRGWEIRVYPICIYTSRQGKDGERTTSVGEYPGSFPQDYYPW